MRPLIAALFFLLLALPVRADFTLGLTAPALVGWEEGLAAYERGDYGPGLPPRRREPAPSSQPTLLAMAPQ